MVSCLCVQIIEEQARIHEIAHGPDCAWKWRRVGVDLISARRVAKYCITNEVGRETAYARHESPDKSDARADITKRQLDVLAPRAHMRNAHL